MVTPRPAIPLDESEWEQLRLSAGVGLRHHPTNVLKVVILPFKVRLADPVVLWWKALQDYVLVPAVRRALLRFDIIQAVAAPVFLVEKIIGIFI